MTGTWRISEGADSIGGFIFVRNKEVVQALVANGFHKPFDVRAGKVVESLEAEAGILDENGALNYFCCLAAFGQGDFFDRTLNLLQVDCLALYSDGGL